VISEEGGKKQGHGCTTVHRERPHPHSSAARPRPRAASRAGGATSPAVPPPVGRSVRACLRPHGPGSTYQFRPVRPSRRSRESDAGACRVASRFAQAMRQAKRAIATGRFGPPKSQGARRRDIPAPERHQAASARSHSSAAPPACFSASAVASPGLARPTHPCQPSAPPGRVAVGVRRRRCPTAGHSNRVTSTWIGGSTAVSAVAVAGSFTRWLRSNWGAALSRTKEPAATIG